jgi:hypothetical protein
MSTIKAINGTKTIQPFPRDATVEEIVETLSPAERDAMVKVFSFQTLVEQETSETKLRMTGLWKRGKLKRGESHFTPLGEKVALYIKKSRKSVVPAAH